MSKKSSTPQDHLSHHVTTTPEALAPHSLAASVTLVDSFFTSVRLSEPNQTALTKVLKEYPAFSKHVDASGFNALTLALLSRKNELAKILIEMDSDVNLASTAMGWCPLVIAAGTPPHTDALARLLLSKGAHPSSKTHDGLYALTAACTYGNLSLATLLLDSGAHASPADAAWLPIIAAAGSGHVDLLNLLVEHGANPDQRLSQLNGFRSIHQACRTGHADMVLRLIELKVDLNAMNNEGNTPLHFAAQRGDLSIIEALLQSGAKPFLENVFGKTPADLCSDLLSAKSLATKKELRLKHPDAGNAKKAALAAKKADKDLMNDAHAAAPRMPISAKDKKIADTTTQVDTSDAACIHHVVKSPVSSDATPASSVTSCPPLTSLSSDKKPRSKPVITGLLPPAAKPMLKKPKR